MRAPRRVAVSNVAIYLWVGAGVLIGVVGVLAVGVAAYSSETAGVEASLIAAVPVGFGVGGAVGAWMSRHVYKQTQPQARHAPIGCACAGAVLLLGLVMAFLQEAGF